MKVTFEFSNDIVRQAHCVLTGEILTDEQISDAVISTPENMNKTEQVAICCAILQLLQSYEKEPISNPLKRNL